MTKEELSHTIELLLKGQAATPQQLEQLRAEYPFFTLPDAVTLYSPQAQSLTPHQRELLNARVALNAPDAQSLIKQLDPDGKQLAAFYPSSQPAATPTTTDALDTFLETYGNVDPREQALLERLIFNPVPADYAQLLQQEAAADEAAESRPVSTQDALLDAFLATQEHKAKEVEPSTAAQLHTQVSEIKPDPEAPLSESLAKMYIRRQRYDKAYEIIRQLSLNFPKKSIYFADQMRFLKKLIINQRAGKKM